MADRFSGSILSACYEQSQALPRFIVRLKTSGLIAADSVAVKIVETEPVPSLVPKAPVKVILTPINGNLIAEITNHYTGSNTLTAVLAINGVTQQSLVLDYAPCV